MERSETLKTVYLRTGISAGLLHLYESGTSVPGYWNMLELARYFNVTLDYLAGITSQRKEYPNE